MDMTAATAGFNSHFFMSRDVAAGVVFVVALIVGVALLIAAVRHIRRFQDARGARYTDRASKATSVPRAADHCVVQRGERHSRRDADFSEALSPP